MTTSTSPAPNRSAPDGRPPAFEDSAIRPAPKGAWLWVLLAATAVSGAAFAMIGWNLVGFLAVAYLLFLVGVYVTYTIISGPRQGKDQLMRSLVHGAFVLALLPLLSILWTVLETGSSVFGLDFLNQSMRGVTGVHDQAYVEEGAPLVGGAYHAIIGTLIVTGIAGLISVPIGLMTAIYLVEYGGRGRLPRSIRFFVDVMTGIPSIVAGLFAVTLFGVLFGVGTSNGVAGAVALSVLMIPTVVRNSEEMLRIVPNELREAALALGVPQWKVITKVVLPTAASGLASGVTLAVSRVIGETAPLLLAVGFTSSVNTNPLAGPMNTLAVYAYQMFKFPLSPGYRDPSIDRAWAAVLILVVFVIALNLTARLIARLFAPKTGG